jgi:hypothetical protein
MPSNKEAKRTLYCRRQASACAVAASTAACPETKQAYLELERGWLCLASKAESPSDQPFPLAQRQTELASDPDGDASDALTDAAPDGATPVSFRSTDTQNFTDSQNGFARVRAK